MNVISPLIQFHQQLRIFHWQTDSYSKHKAFGKAYDALDELIDNFLETFMGNFGRSKPVTSFELELRPYSETNVDLTIQFFIDYLKNMDLHISEYSDLLNIRDEILAEINKLKYLLKLN